MPQAETQALCTCVFPGFLEFPQLRCLYEASRWRKNSETAEYLLQGIDLSIWRSYTATPTLPLTNAVYTHWQIPLSPQVSVFFSIKSEWYSSLFKHCFIVVAVVQSPNRIRLFATLYTVVPQVPLSMEFFQARILEWVAIPFSRGSAWPRDWTRVCCISCIGRWVLYHRHHLGSPRPQKTVQRIVKNLNIASPSICR